MKPTFIRIVFFVLLSFSSALLTGCGESKPKVDVAAQIRALDGNTEAKQEALTQLGTQGKGAMPALDKLIELLKDPDPVVVPESLLTAEKPVAGRPWQYLAHVSRPTMTVYPARGQNTGAAVIVFPGGGYHILAIDLEGTEVCEWLASRGITAVLLAYRVPFSGPHWYKPCRCHRDPRVPAALEDAQRTVGLVRAQSASLGVDPHRIGVLGFSAGGHLVADVSTHWKRRAYKPVDEADSTSCRPDFGVAIYPGHLTEHTTREHQLNPTVPVTAETPPTFLLQATDDPVDDVENSLVYYRALQKAKVPVEMHLFARGGHAFGLRQTSAPITRWPELLEAWLGEMGFLGAR